MSKPEQRQVDRMTDHRFHFKSRDAVDGEANTMNTMSRDRPLALYAAQPPRRA